MKRPDVVAFVRARLDEDEAVARPAIRCRPAPWRTQQLIYHGSTADTSEPTVSLGKVIVWSGGQSVMSTSSDWDAAVGLHIAAHDPARSLREVAALREVVRAHVEGDAWCDHCDPSFGSEDCPTLCALASIWPTHPDYNQEWTQRTG